MTKLGYFTDTHVRAETPSGRTDNYKDSILTKLEEIGSIFKTNNVDYALFGGDLFHTPDPVNSLKYDVMHIFKSWQIPIVAVIGSHDYFGYQAKSIKRTAVGLFAKAGIIDIIGVDNYPEYLECGEFVITGTSHTYDFVQNKNIYKPTFNIDKKQIQMVHADLNNKPVIWPHVQIKEVTTESDVVLIGHIHNGFVPTTIKNTTFYNPGSIGRLENTNKPRTPEVVILYNNEGKVILNTVKLTSALLHPFKDKIDASDVEVVQDITRFLTLLETSTVDVVDIKKQIQTIADELGETPEVVAKTFSILETL